MNRFSSVADLTGKQKGPGVGTAPAFLCALCAKPRVQLGRRLRRVQGLKQWVCAGCAK